MAQCARGRFFNLRCEDVKTKLRSFESGYTLPDMLVALMLVAIIGAIAVPRFATTDDFFHRLNARSYLLQDLKRAQAEAITMGCRGVFTIAPGGRSYTFGCDYLDYDTNVPPQADRISFTRHLPGQVQVSADAPIIFNSRGLSVDSFGVMLSVNLSLTDAAGGERVGFATGTLLGTGVFSMDQNVV